MHTAGFLRIPQNPGSCETVLARPSTLANARVQNRKPIWMIPQETFRSDVRFRLRGYRHHESSSIITHFWSRCCQSPCRSDGAGSSSTNSNVLNDRGGRQSGLRIDRLQQFQHFIRCACKGPPCLPAIGFRKDRVFGPAGEYAPTSERVGSKQV